MAIYTDKTHLVSDVSVEELHAFAEKIGLKRHWFEGVRKGHPHYDLMGKNKQLAIDNGAIVVSSKEIVKICRKLYETFPKRQRLKLKSNTKQTPDEKH